MLLENYKSLDDVISIVNISVVHQHYSGGTPLALAYLQRPQNEFEVQNTGVREEVQRV